jgi:hypothetical protein
LSRVDVVHLFKVIFIILDCLVRDAQHRGNDSQLYV